MGEHARRDRKRRRYHRARMAACRCDSVNTGVRRGGAMKPRVVVAMSGGVDSSVAAAILSEQGCEVVGIAMRLAQGGDGPSYRARRGACCSYEDFEDARRVAERLDFPFYVVDMREEFGNRVIGNFVS